MAQIKNFGLVGVGSDVQFGKAGPRLLNDTGVFKFRNAADAAFADVHAKELKADALKAGVGQLVTVDATGQLTLGAVISTLATDAEVVTAIADEATARNTAIAAEATLRTAADTLIRTDFAAADAVVTAAFIAADELLQGSITGLDGRLDTAESDIGAIETAAGLLTTRVTTAEGDISALEAADTLLDGRLDALELLATNNTADMQIEIDAIETAIGLNTDGTKNVFTSVNYINASDTFFGAVNAIDAAIKARADAIVTEISDRNAAILVETNARIAADALKLNLTGGTMSGVIDMGGSKITGLGAPTLSGDAATKNYVDSLVTGLTWDAPVNHVVADTTARDALVGLIAGDTVATTNNMLYTYDGDSFDAGVAFADGAAFFDKATDSGYVSNGTTLVQFTGAGQVNAGTGLVKTGNTLSLDFHASGGLFTTVDGMAANSTDGSQVAIKLDGDSLSLSSSGIKVATATLQLIADNTTAIGVEVARAEAAELVLSGDLAAEIVTARAAELLLTNDLSDEVARAIASETAISASITAITSGLASGGIVFAGATAGTIVTDSGISYNSATDTLTVAGNIIAAEPTLGTHLTTKTYVDNKVNALGPVAKGFWRTFEDGTTAIPFFAGLITRIKVNIQTPGTSVSIGTLVTSDLVDAAVTGIYVIECADAHSNSLNIVSSGAEGIVIIEYLSTGG